jgi:5'-3' exonuclease
MRHRAQLIDALEAEGIEFVVAPFEADAQLAYALPLQCRVPRGAM